MGEHSVNELYKYFRRLRKNRHARPPWVPKPTPPLKPQSDE